MGNITTSTKRHITMFSDRLLMSCSLDILLKIRLNLTKADSVMTELALGSRDRSSCLLHNYTKNKIGRILDNVTLNAPIEKGYIYTHPFPVFFDLDHINGHLVECSQDVTFLQNVNGNSVLHNKDRN